MVRALLNQLVVALICLSDPFAKISLLMREVGS